jgi:hypothetical protein
MSPEPNMIDRLMAQSESRRRITILLERVRDPESSLHKRLGVLERDTIELAAELALAALP